MFWKIKILLPVTALILGITGSALAATGNFPGIKADTNDPVSQAGMMQPIDAPVPPTTPTAASVANTNPAPGTNTPVDPVGQQRHDAMNQAVQSGDWQQMFDVCLSYWGGDWQKMYRDSQNYWNDDWQKMYDICLSYVNEQADRNISRQDSLSSPPTGGDYSGQDGLSSSPTGGSSHTGR